MGDARISHDEYDANTFAKFRSIVHDATGKNSVRSIEKRKEGNKLYGSKDHDADVHLQILSLYTESAALAENGSEELALAFSNRSALLLHLSKYEECLIDVDRAQRITKSKELKAKLATRKAKCLSLLQGSEANKSPNEEPNLLPEMRPSKVIPCVSELVSLKFDEKYGRYMVANQDIEPGTIVAMERGFLFPKMHKLYLNCSHCLNLAWNGIPCDSCTCLIYCSERCKEEAWSQYHKIECTVLPYLKYFQDEGNNMTNLMATFRIFIECALEIGLKNLIQQADEIETNHGTYLNALFQRNKFQNVYTLSMASGNYHSKENTFFLSAFVNVFLDKTEIFKTFELSKSKSILKNDINKIIWNLKGIVDNNAYAFDHVKCNNDPYTDGDAFSKYKIGVTISSICSLINHSCASNVERTFTDGQIILYTSDYIKKGEQLFITYGPDISVSASYRKSYLLEKYNFICDCDPCKANWFIDDYDQRQHMDLVSELRQEFTKMGTDNTFAGILNPAENNYYPITENILNDVKKMIKKINEHCAQFDAMVLNILLRNYVCRYINSFYGMKLNMPKKC